MNTRLGLIWVLAPLFVMPLLGSGYADKTTPLTEVSKPDIVMIDGGISVQMRGILNIDPSPNITADTNYHIHGYQMVMSMQNQLILLEASPVNVIQIPFAPNSGDVADQINQAANLDPKVITMALSGSDRSERERAALMYANSKGILVVIAAGNTGTRLPEYPARLAFEFDCVVAVSTSHHNEHKKVDSANSGEIYYPKVPGENGTSFSTARAGALVMRYFQVNPTATCKNAKHDLIRVFDQP